MIFTEHNIILTERILDMKRKYYLRGLGIGILVTTLVFIVAGPSGLSDDEIIKRAEKLGYVKEAEVTPSIGIKELLESGTPTPTAVPTPEPTKILEPTKQPEPTLEPAPEPITTAPTEIPVPKETPLPTVEPTSTPKPQSTATPAPEPTIAPESTVVTAIIVIERGNTATVVCDKIEEAGIIEDGKKLRNYLIENELTDYINVGEYTLSSDMSLKEIAKILTGR